MSRAYIQFQDRSGMWRTVTTCDADQITIKHRLDDAERSYGRVRAIDTNSNSLIDLRG